MEKVGERRDEMAAKSRVNKIARKREKEVKRERESVRAQRERGRLGLIITPIAAYLRPERMRKQKLLIIGP